METCIGSEKKERWRENVVLERECSFRERSEHFFCTYLKYDHRHSHADRERENAVLEREVSIFSAPI